jgi:hypothetical protein
VELQENKERIYYNFIKPYQALDGKTPAEEKYEYNKRLLIHFKNC